MTIKATHSAIKAYHDKLAALKAHHATHEGATETAFSHLLATTANAHGWALIPKQPLKLPGGKTIIPDGTLRDLFNLPRGHWEAKDTQDDLDIEIQKKIDRKYPLTNIIFEDTREAVLFQSRKEQGRFDLNQPQQVADLLNQFYAYTEPDIEGFDQAVAEFKERVPELAEGLNEKIKKAHQVNAKFKQAFAEFFEMCQTALNPNIRRDAVDEMLIQHLLTERLFRRIFHDEEFTRRNVIAAEVEKVIAALVSKSFSRADFLKSLDKFYKAIELAADTIDSFGDKQHFLNTVYERFFQGYSVKTADTHGIVYTPQPIVDFMCASVEEVLKSEFGLTLGSPGVNILDPCTGTGNFIVNLLRRVPKKDLPRVYREQLFANEVMLLPYYIAALNIEHAYAELTGGYESFEGLCFVDTLELAEEKPHLFSGMEEKNTERVERQKKAPITVIIGNPPYNMGQLNENDNNKNRAYRVIDQRIRETFAAASKATLKTKLYDAYVRFFRWAIDRLEGRNGIVCYVSNNSFVDQFAFDGMRKHVFTDFTHIIHLNLEGNVRHNPTLAGTAYNVFGIQVGVGITVAIRNQKAGDHRLDYAKVEKTLRRHEKLAWLIEHDALSTIKWNRVVPDERANWIISEHAAAFDECMPIGSKEAKAVSATDPHTIFRTYSPGVNTARDDVVYDEQQAQLLERITKFVEDYNAEVDRFRRSSKHIDIDDFVRYEDIKWSYMLKAKLQRFKSAEYKLETVRRATYRPFHDLYLYFDEVLIDARGLQPYFFPNPETEKSNISIVVPGAGSEKPFMTIVVGKPADFHVVGAGCSSQCFPFYVYDEDGTNRRDNITDWALKQFQTQYKSKRITKWDIFYYVYGLLHHPGYRTKFADNLKRELPRIPFASDFKAFAKAGKQLADLHLNYEQLEPFKLTFVTNDRPLSYRVTKMKLTKDKTALIVNESLTLAGIPPDVFEYRLGNRSALDWVIDQYRETEDARSGIVSDPNREDDPEYIVRLVGQVVKVSRETVKLVNGLPKEYSGK